MNLTPQQRDIVNHVINITEDTPSIERTVLVNSIAGA